MQIAIFFEFPTHLFILDYLFNLQMIFLYSLMPLKAIGLFFVTELVYIYFMVYIYFTRCVHLKWNKYIWSLAKARKKILVQSNVAIKRTGGGALYLNKITAKNLFSSQNIFISLIFSFFYYKINTSSLKILPMIPSIWNYYFITTYRIIDY